MQFSSQDSVMKQSMLSQLTKLLTEVEKKGIKLENVDLY